MFTDGTVSSHTNLEVMETIIQDDHTQSILQDTGVGGLLDLMVSRKSRVRCWVSGRPLQVPVHSPDKQGSDIGRKGPVELNFVLTSVSSSMLPRHCQGVSKNTHVTKGTGVETEGMWLS